MRNYRKFIFAESLNSCLIHELIPKSDSDWTRRFLRQRLKKLLRLKEEGQTSQMNVLAEINLKQICFYIRQKLITNSKVTLITV
jgi:hypothetical protein